MVSVATRVYKNVALESDLIEQIDSLVRASGGRAGGATFSGELNRLLRLGLQRHAAEGQGALLAPELSAVLDEKLAALERRLGPVALEGARQATTAVLMALYLLEGARIGRDQRQGWYDAVRAHAQQVLRTELAGGQRREGAQS